MRWAVQGSTCKYYELVCSINTLDISCGEDENIFKATEIADVLSHLLPHCSSLAILDISGNHFSRELIESILPVILQLPKLQRLNLDGKPQTKPNNKSKAYFEYP
jgi:Ran GTPase-activating protein (RanGAP) involved in mRNA processing and transport